MFVLDGLKLYCSAWLNVHKKAMGLSPQITTERAMKFLFVLYIHWLRHFNNSSYNEKNTNFHLYGALILRWEKSATGEHTNTNTRRHSIKFAFVIN